MRRKARLILDSIGAHPEYLSNLDNISKIIIQRKLSYARRN